MPYPTKKLGEVCEISAGGSAPQGERFFENGKYPFFRTSDVGAVHLSDNLCDVRDYLNDQGIKKLNLFKKGTILFPKSGASTFLNHRVIMGCDGYVASHLATISAGEKVDFKYLYFFLTLVDAKDIAPNSSYPSLRIADIAKIEIPLPPLSEQKKIVAKLERVLGKISEAKKLRAEARENADNLLPAELHKIFEEGKKKDWEEKELGEISKVVTGGTPKTHIAEYYGGEYLWARPGDLNEDLVVATEKKLSLSGFEDGGVRPIPAGSVMMCCIGSIGKIGIASEEMSTNQQINSFVPDIKKIDGKFLFYSLIYVRDKFIAGASSTTLKIINKSRCEKIKIPLPPLAEQKKIVGQLDSLSEKIEKIKNLQSATQNNFIVLEQAVLSKSFSGKL